jgi:hypothetical protein
MENELLEISQDFKIRIKKKNIIISKMKKLICILYGLIVVTHDNEDISLIQEIRNRLSLALTEFLGVESDDEEEELVPILEINLNS